MNLSTLERVQRTVEEIVDEGADGFHASYIAAQTGVPIDEAREALVALVSSGDLTDRFELVCPSCGRTIATYSLNEALPLGAPIPCDREDEPLTFVPSEQDFLVTYRPTQSLLSRLRRHGGVIRKKALGWARRKKIG